MHRLSIGFIVLLFILLTTCKKDQQPEPTSNQQFLTKPATIFDSGSVIFVGQINEIPQGLEEYGFLVSPNADLSSADKIKITSPAAIGQFTSNVYGYLQKNRTYYVAVYSIQNGGTLKMYNTISFNTSNGLKIIVNSILPTKADIGDTIIFRGKYFLSQPLNIFFDNSSATTIIQNDSTLKCIVPSLLKTSTPVITIKNTNKVDTLANSFSLNNPTISDFTPIATFRDTVTINGDHFGRTNALNAVNFGDVSATIVSSSSKKLKVLVPDNIKQSFTNITVTSQLQSVVSTGQFQITKPVITSITPSANINDPVTISGKYFHPLSSGNLVYSENNLAQLSSVTTTKITYNVPNAPYPLGKATITLKMLDYTVTYSADMVIKDKWLLVSKVPFNDYGSAGAFTINNTSYVIASSQDYLNNQQFLWKFNPTDLSWQQIVIPFICTNAKVTTNGNKAYLYTSSATNNFYEFDPATNQWTKKTDYPVVAVRQSGAMFAIGTKVYLGIGTSTINFGTPVADNSFYEYNISTNNWQRIADYPDPADYGARLYPSLFIIDNVAYVGCGATNTGMVSFYSYSSGSWNRVHDFPVATTYATGFAFGNYGYVAGVSHDCFKYDPATDIWTRLDASIGCVNCGRGIERGYAFVNNGYVYVGGGNSSSSTYFLYRTVGNAL